MKKTLVTILASVLVFTGCGNSQDKEVNENTEDLKIIATSSDICQILDKLDIDLIGIPTTTIMDGEIPERYSGVTEIGTPMTPDFEIIKSLNATDVILPLSLEENFEEDYAEIGINSTFINLRNIEKMYEDILNIGEKYNREEEARLLLDEFNAVMSNLEIDEENSPTVLILVGAPGGAYLVATGHSYMGNLVQLAGGENVFTDDTEAFLSIPIEEMLEKQPDIILRIFPLPSFESDFEKDSIWDEFNAVLNGQVYDLDYELFGISATLEYSEALEILCKIFYEN